MDNVIGYVCIPSMSEEKLNKFPITTEKGNVSFGR